MRLNEVQSATDKKIIGVLVSNDSSYHDQWGTVGIDLTPSHFLELQVLRFLIEDWFGSEEEFHLVMSDDGIEYLPVAVRIVPKNLYDLVDAAWRATPAGNDSAHDAQTRIISAVFDQAAQQTIKLDWSKIKDLAQYSAP